MKTKIAIANDHAATALKTAICDHLAQYADAYEVSDLGAGASAETPADYPAYAKRVAEAVAEGRFDLGLLVCGTGAGMCIAANKVRGVRAVVCSEPYTAQLSRMHNNANILCLGARVVGVELAKMIVDAYLAACFEGGRHANRVAMISEMEHTI